MQNILKTSIHAMNCKVDGVSTSTSGAIL